MSTTSKLSKRKGGKEVRDEYAKKANPEELASGRKDFAPPSSENSASATTSASAAAASSKQQEKEKQISVKEVEDTKSIYKNIPKKPGAPYVQGLEPVRYGPPARLGGEGDENGDGENLKDGRYLASSTRGAGFLLWVVSAFLLFLWISVYNANPVSVSGISYGNGAPPTAGFWSNVEFSLDKTRILETLKNFPIVDKSDVFGEWLRHPFMLDLCYQLTAAFVLTATAITIAKAIPNFWIFVASGISFLTFIAAIGDAVLVGHALNCFDVSSVNTTRFLLSKSPTQKFNKNSYVVGDYVKYTDCRLPLIMHSFCVNIKWVSIAIASALLIIFVRFRGGFFAGIFRWFNITLVATLPLVAHALRFYFWYNGLGLVAEAVAQHGWILTKHEKILDMTFAAATLSQVFVLFLFGLAMMQQDTLLVLEQEIPEEPKKEGEEEKKQEEKKEEKESSKEEKKQAAPTTNGKEKVE